MVKSLSFRILPILFFYEQHILSRIESPLVVSERLDRLLLAVFLKVYIANTSFVFFYRSFFVFHCASIYQLMYRGPSLMHSFKVLKCNSFSGAMYVLTELRKLGEEFYRRNTQWVMKQENRFLSYAPPIQYSSTTASSSFFLSFSLSLFFFSLFLSFSLSLSSPQPKTGMDDKQGSRGLDSSK